MSGLADYLPEAFAEFGPVTLRRMFGGHGIYHQGLMFALVIDDTLYLKADAGNLAFFEREQLEPFRYERKDGKVATVAYHRAPDALLDDREIAAEWARRSFAAALRTQARKKPGRRSAK